MLVILILQQSLKCKTCNARKSVIVKEKKKKNSFCKLQNMQTYCSKCKKTYL